MIYATSYTTLANNYPRFQFELWADNQEHAKQLIDQRGMGETLLEMGVQSNLRGVLNILEPFINDLYTDRLHVPHYTARLNKWSDAASQAAHEASQLCSFACASGVIDAQAALSDVGIVHELLHIAQFTESCREEFQQTPGTPDFMHLIAHVEMATPGWPRFVYHDKYANRDKFKPHPLVNDKYGYLHERMGMI